MKNSELKALLTNYQTKFQLNIFDSLISKIENEHDDVHAKIFQDLNEVLLAHVKTHPITLPYTQDLALINLIILSIGNNKNARYKDFLSELKNEANFLGDDIEEISSDNIYFNSEGYVLDLSEISSILQSGQCFTNPYTKTTFPECDIKLMKQHSEIKTALTNIIGKLKNQLLITVEKNKIPSKSNLIISKLTWDKLGKLQKTLLNSDSEFVMAQFELKEFQDYYNQLPKNEKAILSQYSIFIDDKQNNNKSLISFDQIMKESSSQEMCLHKIGGWFKNVYQDLDPKKGHNNTKEAISWLGSDDTNTKDFKKKKIMPKASVLAHSMRNVLSEIPKETALDKSNIDIDSNPVNLNQSVDNDDWEKLASDEIKVIL